MPSIMSHAVVASSLGAAGAPERPMPARYWVTLALVAAAPDADVIAFCGVHFMADTAKIVNPSKIVVLPDNDAG